MPFNELMRSAVREAQLMDEREAANEPRQAHVIRPEGNGVWVRLGGEEVTAPESWFPSTHAGVAPGTMGWVYPVGGGKGLFVVTGVPSHKPLSNVASVSISVSTSANTTIPDASVMFTGLIPGRVYTIDATAELVVNGTSADTFISWEAQGSSSVRPTNARRTRITKSYEHASMRRTVECAANSNGEITVSPVYAWISGSFTIVWASITASIH